MVRRKGSFKVIALLGAILGIVIIGAILMTLDSQKQRQEALDTPIIRPINRDGTCDPGYQPGPRDRSNRAETVCHLI